jgi:hypothetical protein
MAMGSSARISNHPVIEPRTGRFYKWTSTVYILYSLETSSFDSAFFFQKKKKRKSKLFFENKIARGGKNKNEHQHFERYRV